MLEEIKFDANFKVASSIEKEDVCFYDVMKPPFSLHGLMYENNMFCRLPHKVAEQVSEGVYSRNTNPSGGRVRFRTDSPYVAIHTEMPYINRNSHYSLAGSAGFDIYIGDRCVKTFVPPYKMEDGYESVVDLPKGEKDILIHFPYWCRVSSLHIGIAEGASLLPPAPYGNEKPVVFYGSSITQGSCASHSGNSYQNMLSRRLNFDYINLGFSGCARAEKPIVDYICGLDMSIFVMDYDHNAPTPEYLQQTHEPMFLAIREAHPEMPIILMSRPRRYRTTKDQQRLEIVRATYENALARGDKNVYFLDGDALTELCGHDGLVDGTHPNDFGFASMAHALEPVLKKLL